MAAFLVFELGTHAYSWGWDFSGYWAAAHLHKAHGWRSLYDGHLQAQTLRALGISGFGGTAPQYYIAPPPLLWLALPLAAAPLRLAAVIWTLLQIAALVAAWWIAAPRGVQARVLTLLAAAAAFPVAYCLFYGQATCFIVLGVAASYRLLKDGRPFLAGLALCALVIKPQEAFLLPAVLALGGQWRVFAGWAAGTAVLAAASVALVGFNGIEQLIALQRANVGIGTTQGFFTQAIGLPASLPVSALIIAAACFAAWRTRDLAALFWIGICASLAATPYLHYVDLALLLPAGWIVLRERGTQSLRAAWLVALTWVAAELTLVSYPATGIAQAAVWAVAIFALTRSPEATPESVPAPVGA